MDDSRPKQHALTNEQRKALSAQRLSMEVSPYEAQIIKELRKMSHGRFTIQMLDDIPVRFIEEKSTMVLEGTDAFETLEKTLKSR